MNMKIYLSLIGALVFVMFGYLPNAYAELTVGNYILESKERASRTEYSYTYKAEITNSGDAVENAAATVNSLSTNTKVVTDNLTFGAVGADETVTSNDSFTITQNRKFPFNPDDLIWEITADPAIPNLPPDPGEAGKATLEGIDSDNDGVRDDIQRYIAFTYPDSEKIRAVLAQYSKSMQKAILNSDSKNASLDNTIDISKSAECLRFIKKASNTTDKRSALLEAFKIENLLLAEITNTEPRLDSYLFYDSNLGGEVFPIPTVDSQTACDFNLNNLPN